MVGLSFCKAIGIFLACLTFFPYSLFISYLFPMFLCHISFLLFPTFPLPRPAGGRGASVCACADLTNQLQRCWVDPACAWNKH